MFILRTNRIPIRFVHRPQGDHKGSPLLCYEAPCEARSSIVGAIPCGRPAVSTFPTSILIYCLFCLMLLASCTGSTTTTTPTPAPTRTATLPSNTPTTTPTAAQTPTAGSTGATTPQHFRSHVLLRGVARPDDLVFDRQGNVLFSDFYNGTVSRLNKDGTATVLLSGQAGPEGLIVLPDGTMIFAEQRTNRILSLAPGAQSPTLLRVLPGTPSSASCKDGVDGIALDPSTNTIIVPDSPIGNVYSLSLDGKTLTLLASGITRPVGATVDDHGNIYVADECGGAVWRIAPGGATTRIGGFGMPDDVAFDPHGNLLVIDLEPSIHALIRMNLITGKRETLANQGFIEPQGLIVDKNDNIYVSDDYADIIVEYEPA